MALHRLLWLALALLLAGGGACAAVLHAQDFEGGALGPWSVPQGRESTTVEVVGPAAGVEAFGGDRCLRMSGTQMWNLADLTPSEPIVLDQPVWLSWAWRAEGPVGQMAVNLLIEGEPRPVFSTVGHVGRLSVGRWDRLVARLDRYRPDLAGRKLTGLRVAARCEVGAELPEGRAPEHALLIDDVRIATGADAEPARQIAAAEAMPREYAGPQRFTLHRAEGITVWHTPALAPAMEDSAAPEATGDEVRLRLARNEAESFELVVEVTAPGRKVVRLEPVALAAAGGQTIPAEATYWHPVCTVPLITRQGFPVELRWPDPLSHDRQVTVEGPGSAQLWVTVQAPAGTAPGTYTGGLRVTLEGAAQQSVAVPLAVEVLDFELPRSPSFRTNQQLWGPRRGEVRPWLELLGRCKQFDANMWYSDAEERRWRIEELGQNAIKINGVGGHGPTPTRYGDADIGTEAHRTAYVEHVAKNVTWVRENGWEDRAFVYIWDENWGSVQVFEHVDYLAGLIRGITEEIPILAALPVNQRIEGAVNIYLAEYSPPGTIERRRAAGDQFWRWGNVDLQLGKAPLSVRMSYGLESVRRQFTGAYSWGVSAWGDADPWVDPQRDNWSATLFYPGGHEGSAPELPVPSIRMELLRDGIEDYEYAAILRGLLEARGTDDEADRARTILARAEALSERAPNLRRMDEQIDELAALRAELQDAIVRLGREGR